MKTRCLPLLIAGLLTVPAGANAQQLVINPGPTAAVGPVYSYPNGMYSPYPGIVAPVPYPGRTYPPHWIYSYIRTNDAARVREDDVDGKTYRGRDKLAPAVPYSDYLKDQREILKSRGATGQPAGPTVDKALLEIRMPKQEAKLFFDGKEVAGEGEVRSFLTPTLKIGQAYMFQLKATWPGFPDDRVSEQSITFQAGERTVVDLRPKN